VVTDAASTTAAGGGRAGAGDPPARAELRDAPPFLSWRAIYLIVLAALAADIAFGAALTVLFG
jgi:hypothetical protein